MPARQNLWEHAFVSELKARREAIGYSQSKVDALIGCSEGLVAKWETGMRRPSMFMVYCWADALKTRWKLEPIDETR